MSIRVMTRVWEHAKQKEGTLLVLLALADYADDSGVCWPAQPEIAQKARLTDRQIRNVLKGLVDDGELLFVPSKGRGRPAVYCVLTGLDTADRDQRRKWFHGKYFQENISAIPEKRRKLETQKAEIGDTKGGNQRHAKYPTVEALESAEPPISKNDNRHDPSIDPPPPAQIGGGGGGEDMSYEQELRKVLGGFGILAARKIAGQYAVMEQPPAIAIVRTAIEGLIDPREPHNLDRIARRLMDCPPPYTTPTARAPNGRAIPPPTKIDRPPDAMSSQQTASNLSALLAARGADRDTS